MCRVRVCSSHALSSPHFRAPFGKRLAGSVHSSHGNLSQMSLTSSDFQSTEEVDSPGHTRAEKAGEGHANSSADIQGKLGWQWSLAPCARQTDGLGIYPE